VDGGGTTRFLPRDGGVEELQKLTALTSRRLNVVVQSPLLLREVGLNGETTTPRVPTIRSLSIVELDRPNGLINKSQGCTTVSRETKF